MSEATVLNMTGRQGLRKGFFSGLIKRNQPWTWELPRGGLLWCRISGRRIILLKWASWHFCWKTSMQIFQLWSNTTSISHWVDPPKTWLSGVSAVPAFGSMPDNMAVLESQRVYSIAFALYLQPVQYPWDSVKINLSHHLCLMIKMHLGGHAHQRHTFSPCTTFFMPSFYILE